MTKLEDIRERFLAVSRHRTSEPASIRIPDVVIRNSMVIVMLMAALLFTIANPNFATWGNLRGVLVSAAPFALLAIGQTLVILTGGIDLSVGSVVSLSAMTAAWFAVLDPSNPNLYLAFGIAILAGLLVGVANGFMVAALGIPPFVATLATLTAASGLAYAIGGGSPILGIPSEFGTLANTRFLDMPVPVWVMLIGFLLFGILLSRFAFGTRIYAVGGNPIAAQIAGVKVSRVRFGVYVISGTLAGCSGVLFSSRVANAAPTMGEGYELASIAAVVIGGASLFGGRGTVWGTAIGLLLIQTLNNGLDIMLIRSYYQDVVIGVLIAAAVAVDVYTVRRLNG